MDSTLLHLSFATIVFLGKFLVSQELGVHSFAAHVLTALGLFDAIGMRLLCAVVRTCVLLL